MERARYQFLASAGLAQNANARFARGHTLHLRHHFAHGLTGPYDVLLADTLTQLAILLLQAF
jgi:hypothetical protein